ncbi:hypothetical protein EOM39_01430 [Candidatus Gracilibacteria bacterium]|nr:hypothetical protein [Candidatus Gracilibacteria bacterium]
MVTYTTEELVSSSVISKNFGRYLSKISNNEIDKIGVLKNNKLDAVIMSASEYENIIDLLEDFEMQRNAIKLKNKYKQSVDSGLSNLAI